MPEFEQGAPRVLSVGPDDPGVRGAIESRGPADTADGAVDALDDADALAGRVLEALGGVPARADGGTEARDPSLAGPRYPDISESVKELRSCEIPGIPDFRRPPGSAS